MRALQLSRDVIDFSYSREQHAPRRPYMYISSRLSDAQYALYENETINLYMRRFSVKVVAMRDELEQRDLHDSELYILADNPRISEYITIIGEKLGELAERIGSVDRAT